MFSAPSLPCQLMYSTWPLSKLEGRWELSLCSSNYKHIMSVCRAAKIADRLKEIIESNQTDSEIVMIDGMLISYIRWLTSDATDSPVRN